jgi:ADP-ribose pyrophosphatase YjhB (NUDIX family)
MERTTRYQCAIIQDSHILLVKQQGEKGYEWWNVPGGGREAGESEEECIIREAKEETNLDVEIECLLIDEPSHRHSPYQYFKTYLCVPIGENAEPNNLESFDIKWFDLNNEDMCSLEVLNNETTYVMLQRIRDAIVAKQKQQFSK